MIVTFTPNPSLDRTVTIEGELHPGAVHRTRAEAVDPGGKGINVGLGLARAGVDSVAVFPAPMDDLLLTLLEQHGLKYRATAVSRPVRTNLAIISQPAVTTKVNESGGSLTSDEVERLVQDLLQRACNADSVMMCGSLAPGMPRDLYGTLVRWFRKRDIWVGVDTAEEPLVALMEGAPAAAPDFLKPNTHELGQLTGLDAEELEQRALAGDLTSVTQAASALRGQGVSEVLVSLGAAGALLACGEGTWYSPSPDVRVVSTVGAGDSAVAGYLIARHKGLHPSLRLAYAVGYGAAAASMPGTTIPTLRQVSVSPERVVAR